MGAGVVHDWLGVNCPDPSAIEGVAVTSESGIPKGSNGANSDA
jgi:hypothetical protein